MLKILANRTYRHLFLAQVIALVGTGLATVALGLLAFDLAGAQAGAVLGTALAIKMTAYIGVAPIAAAFAERLPRRAMLVSLDLVRAVVALALPFVTEVWQIYVLIFVLQSASAAFTPTFQATIPDILPDEDDYTRALSLSRLAYDLESVASPMLAAALLTVISFHNLFAGTVIGFLASAALVATVLLPKAKQVPRRSIYERTTRGMRIFLATPRLRGLLALNLTVAAGPKNLAQRLFAVARPQLWFQCPARFLRTNKEFALSCFEQFADSFLKGFWVFSVVVSKNCNWAIDGSTQFKAAPQRQPVHAHHINPQLHRVLTVEVFEEALKQDLVRRAFHQDELVSQYHPQRVEAWELLEIADRVRIKRLDVRCLAAMQEEQGTQAEAIQHVGTVGRDEQLPLASSLLDARQQRGQACM